MMSYDEIRAPLPWITSFVNRMDNPWKDADRPALLTAWFLCRMSKVEALPDTVIGLAADLQEIPESVRLALFECVTTCNTIFRDRPSEEFFKLTYDLLALRDRVLEMVQPLYEIGN